MSKCGVTLKLNGRTLEVTCIGNHVTRQTAAGVDVEQHTVMMHGIFLDHSKPGVKDGITDVEIRWDK